MLGTGLENSILNVCLSSFLKERKLNFHQMLRTLGGVTEDGMVAQHHRFNGHEFEQALGDGEGQGSLLCCSPWAAESQT